MARKNTCFIIGPIGKPGSQTRQDADDLLDMIIRPALEIYDFKVTRGDHKAMPNQIDADVIKSVQESDLCIVDLTGLNPNVLYEFGRRDETGKPVILLKQPNQELPVDIATRRCIEFDLNTRHGPRDAVKAIRSFVEPMIDRGFESENATVSLREIADTLQRLERKVDKLTSSGAAAAPAAAAIAPAGQLPEGLTANQAFMLARKQRNVPLAEVAMEHLKLTMDTVTFYDRIVEIAALMGSVKAGTMLIEFAQEFMDTDATYKQKVEYLGCMISFASRQDKEPEILAMVESITSHLLLTEESEDPSLVAQIYNQLNRLYHGVSLLNDDDSYMQKALTSLRKAIALDPHKGSYRYNLAMLLKNSDLEGAREAIEKRLELDGDKHDADHLVLAYKIFRQLGDPRSSEVMEMLEKVNPARAALERQN